MTLKDKLRKLTFTGTFLSTILYTGCAPSIDSEYPLPNTTESPINISEKAYKIKPEKTHETKQKESKPKTLEEIEKPSPINIEGLVYEPETIEVYKPEITEQEIEKKSKEVYNRTS